MMIRGFKAGDLANVRRLLSSTPEAAQWPADSLLSSEENFQVSVAEDEGIVCALMVFRIVSDEAEILNLAVAASQRRRGIGSKLVGDAVSAAKAAGAKTMFLEVRESNEPARKFYSRMGFAEAGRRREYYRQPFEDAVVMIRRVE